MNKINFNNKKIIISTVVAIIIIVLAIFSYNSYQKKELQNKIDNSITQIEQIEKDFKSKEKREEKLAILSSLLKEHSEYEQTKSMIDEVDDKYHTIINEMQQYFEDQYKKILKENTLEDIDRIINREQLISAKTKLSELLQSIQNEKGIVCTENEENEYEKKIVNLVKSCDERLVAIEKEEVKKKTNDEREKTHYENKYFSVNVPKEWIGYWSVTEEKHGTEGTIYQFSYNPLGDNNGGGARIFVVDVTNGLPQNGQVISEPCELVGYTSNKIGVFKGIEAGAGFFSNGATLSVK